MPLLNYTTTVPVGKTAAEIQARLARARAQAVLCEYDARGELVAMSFRIPSAGGPVSFRLPARIDGVLRALALDRGVPRRYKTREQAARVAWRVLKDWVEAQLAIVEAELATMTEVFLPYAQVADGRTVYEALEAGEFKALALAGPKGGD